MKDKHETTDTNTPTPALGSELPESDHLDSEWSGWQGAWAQEEHPTPSPQETLKEVKKRQRKMTFSLCMEIFASLFLVAFYGGMWWIGTLNSPPLLSVAIATFVFLGFWMTHVLQTYKSSHARYGESVREHILQMKIQVDAQLRFLEFSNRALKALLLFFLLWCPWMFWFYSDKYIAKPSSGIIGFGGIFVILLGVQLHNNQKRKKLRAESEELQKTHDTLSHEIDETNP